MLGILYISNIGAIFKEVASTLDSLDAHLKALRNYKHIFIAIEYFIKWAEAYPILDEDTFMIYVLLVKQCVWRFLKRKKITKKR